MAREELWVRFKNGAINAKDAEIVCNMTKNIRHEERIEEIQRRCCMLLEKGKGWDYIGAMCQLMANKESVFMKQGLLDFGADFEQDLDRAAKYVELNLSQLNAAIRRMKQGAKLGEKERAQAMRLGIDVSMSEGSEQLLQLLNDMKAKFEYIGSHPDLVASASMWDGKTDPDPVGQMIERAKREREAAEAENEMTDEEWMEQKAREEAAAMTPSLFAMTPSLSFSVSPTLRDDIRRAAYNKMDAKEHVRLCTMPTVLRMLGEPYGDIYTLPGTISKLVYTHNLAHPEVYRAVEELEDPLFVYRETGKTFVFVLEMEATNNKGVKSNVMAAIELERSGSGHYLMSAYPLDALSKIKDLQKQGRLVYSKYTAQELEEAINKQATPPTDNAPSPFKLGLMRSAVKDGLSEIVMTKQDIVKFNPPNFTASMTREQMDARSKRFNYRSENVSFNISGANEQDVYAAERAEIERAARANGTWLKAPNGEDSKLTPEQWTAVRTRAFKRWFGDWEKDPEHASRIVDENGEPLVVYHGTARSKPIGIFKGGKSGYLGPGIYFTPEKNTASKYTGMYGDGLIYECFVNMRNPLAISYADKPAQVILDAVSDGVYEKRIETQGNESQLLKKADLTKLRKKGYDGIVWAPKKALDEGSFRKGEMLLFESNQLKSATGNRGTYDAGNADITFNMNRYGNAERYMSEAWAGDPRARLSGTSYAMEKNLAAVHSLSPEKFLAAVELGGMPMPSVAITRLDRPYEWGGAGAINLIGKPEMVDPKKRSKVYMHDAYTGTMPPVKYKRKNAAAAERLKQDALDKLAAYGMGEGDGLRRGIFSEDEEVMDGDAADWGYNRAMMAYWAITQAGYAPKPKMTEKPGQMSKDKYGALKPWVAKLKKKDMKPEDFTAEELEAFRGVMVAYYEGKKLRGAAKEYREMEAWRLARCAREEADKVRNYSTAKVPDGLENGKRFYEYVKKHAKAYSAWCKAEAQKYLGDKVFQRKYERRNWRGDVVDEWWGHEKYTLGNVLKYLRENKARGEEMNSITPGVFLAGVAEEMRNMREIGWARERVVGAEEYKKAKDEYEEAFSAFYDKACEIGREAGGGYFDLADAAMYNLLELVQGGKLMPARESVARALEQSGGKWTEESVDAAMHLLDKALSMPSDYMEAVPQRAVSMNEWEYAVLPKGLKKNKEVTDALKANGIQPIWHDGTEEGRKAALAGLVNEPSVSFNIAGANEQDAYAAERAEIERAARANGTWLKAPNGEDSKLTPEQWTAVRTRAFKRWFGDWEKDPEHASRIVDENGEPLVVYHGTRRGGFRVFRTEGRGKTSDTGAFFSSSRDNAEGYAMNEDGEVPKEMLYEVFLNIREPETVDFKGNNWNRVPDRPVGYIVKFKSGDTEWYDNLEEAESAADMYESDPGTVEEDWGDGSEGFTLDDFAREVREEGYSDGLIAENIIDHAATGRRVSNEPATDYIVFDPKQIKSATDNVGSYDAGNADITFNVQRKMDLTMNGEHMSREQALEHLKTLEGKPLMNAASRFIAVINKPQRKELTNINKAKISSNNGFSVDAHYAAVNRIEKLFEHAVYCGEYPDLKHGEDTLHIHRFACPMMIDGEKAVAWLTAKQTTNVEGSERLYNLELVNIEKLAVTLEHLGNYRIDTLLRPASRDIIVDVENAFKTYFENVPDFGIFSSENMVEMIEEGRNNSYSMTRGAEDALTILRKRETEREGERLIREWQKQCELWSRLGGTDDAKIGKGSRIFGEMMALVSATKGVLPPEYTRMRGLGMSLQWAEIYADMANKGEVPMRGVMKGSIYDKFVSAIEKRREKDLLHGLTAEDAAENLKELAGRKLESIMQTVAETCRRHLESYLKNRERVRLEKVAGAAMPKEEPGKKTPRGKVSADIVRQVRRAIELMDKTKNEIADEIDAAKEGLNRLDPDDPEYAAKEEMLQEQTYMAKTTSAPFSIPSSPHPTNLPHHNSFPFLPRQKKIHPPNNPLDPKSHSTPPPLPPSTPVPGKTQLRQRTHKHINFGTVWTP